MIPVWQREANIELKKEKGQQQKLDKFVLLTKALFIHASVHHATRSVKQKVGSLDGFQLQTASAWLAATIRHLVKATIRQTLASIAANGDASCAATVMCKH